LPCSWSITSGSLNTPITPRGWGIQNGTFRQNLYTAALCAPSLVVYSTLVGWWWCLGLRFSGWANVMYGSIECKAAGLKTWLKTMGPMSWWSDCAGGDMPYWVATTLGLKVETAVACDNEAGPQKMILRNNPPGMQSFPKGT
jgi:hypothetical protein